MQNQCLTICGYAVYRDCHIRFVLQYASFQTKLVAPSLLTTDCVRQRPRR